MLELVAKCGDKFVLHERGQGTFQLSYLGSDVKLVLTPSPMNPKST